MAEVFLLFGVHCYGGMASTVFARSLLALEAACAAGGIRLRTDLGGGEALVSRARAGLLAQFLRGEATHLVIGDGDIGFAPDALLRLVHGGKPVAGAAAADGGIAPGLLVVRRDAARTVADAYPSLQASLRDVRGASDELAPMVFEGLIEPGTGRYLADLDAFCRRARDAGVEVFADPHLPPWR
ncbi:hypothetical protein [Phenylobacterium sp.]|uniref:hypothetical protein n=1 Tax=Phenylobacterium sp. TaxID=1871053 RepID=UPI002F9205FA